MGLYDRFLVANYLRIKMSPVLPRLTAGSGGQRMGEIFPDFVYSELCMDRISLTGASVKMREKICS